MTLLSVSYTLTHSLIFCPFVFISGFLIYSIGFPAYVFWITWFYRVQIKLDQLLRAFDLGDTRDTSVSGFRFTPRKFRSTLRSTYEIRKKYHKLYYHFKPGKVYWMLIILIRKLSIAVFALLFRANIAFLLSCVLMVLFTSYVLQVRNKPYMSMVEREEVKLAHRLKAQQAEDILNSNGYINQLEVKMNATYQLHYELSKSIKQLHENIERTKHRAKSIRTVKTLNDAMLKANQNALVKKNERMKDYYFDYNTVEQVLIMCSILLSLVAIMFESNQFYVTDSNGISTLNTDTDTVVYYTTILVIAAIVRHCGKSFFLFRLLFFFLLL
jgi:hypothetical protein